MLVSVPSTLLQIDVQPPGVSIYQTAVAILLLVALLVVLTILSYRLRWQGLDDDQQRHKAALTRQFNRASPSTTSLSRELLHDRPADARAEIRAALDPDRTTVVEDASLRGALRTVGGEIRAAYAPLLAPFPRSAIRVAQLAVLSTVAGLVAVSTDLVIYLLTDLPAGLTSDGAAPVREVVSGLGSHPLVQQLLTWIPQAILLVGVLLYRYWVVATVLLGGAAVVLTLLEWALNNVGDPPIADRYPRGSKVPKVVPLAVAALFAPFALAWVAVSLTKLPRILGALAAAPVPVQATVALAGLAAVVGVAVAVLRAADELLTALLGVLARQRVRISVLQSGVPLGIVPLVYVLGLGFQMPWWAALIVSVAAACIAFWLLRLSVRARERVRVLEDPTRAPVRVSVNAYRIEDDDGNPHWVVDVSGERLAHRDRAALVEDIYQHARQATDPDRDADPEPTLASTYARDLLRLGIVDPEDTRDRVRQRVRETVATHDEVVAVEDLHDDLSAEYPREVWEACLREWRRSAQLKRRTDNYRIRLS